MKTIVLAVDGSEASARAAKTAIELACAFDAALHVINVPQDETRALVMSGAFGYVPFEPMNTDADLLKAGGEIVATVVAQAQSAGAPSVDSLVRIGDAAAEVLDLAQTVRADLIVSGRRGLGGVASLLVGSTSHRILNAAECACLSVP